jgi:hypothetical protein
VASEEFFSQKKIAAIPEYQRIRQADESRACANSGIRGELQFSSQNKTAQTW